MKANIGDKVYVPGEKRPYTDRVRDDRYIICTKPYNPKRTVLYFIIDLVRNGEHLMIDCSVQDMKLMNSVRKDFLNCRTEILS